MTVHDPKTVAFIGLGHMGLPMAKNLLAAGYTVRGFDVVPACVEAGRDAGLTMAADMLSALEGAGVVITMLPKGSNVEQVYFGPDGLLEHVDAEMLLIDSSTIDIATCRKVHDEAARKGLHFVDAPVSGGISGAAAGTLTFMVGGAAEDVERARQVMQPMAGNIFATGGPTTGQAAKIVNNMMLFISVQACAEGSVLARKLGLDSQVFHDIASVSSANSWAVQTWYPVPGVVPTAAANNEFASTFRADLALKDIGLAMAAAEENGLDLPAAALAQQRLQEAVDGGAADMDCTIVVAAVDPDAPGLPAGYKHGK